MVVGNGLLATSFHDFKEDENLIIFASGVSNSSEENYNEFEKEKKLLLSYISLNKKLIYFSSTSIFDTSLQNSKYVLHKIEIESIIIEKCTDYIIFRLPIILSKSKNKNTLFNFIKNSIIQNEIFKIHKYASRYLIDIDDVKSIVMLNLNKSKKTLNIVPKDDIMVEKIIEEIELILKKKINKHFLLKGSRYHVLTDCLSYFENENSIDYYKRILKKYI